MNDCSYENMRFKITTYDLHSKQTLSMPAINCLAQQGMKIVCFFFFFFDFAIRHETFEIIALLRHAASTN
jgi:hypothetical protein